MSVDDRDDAASEGPPPDPLADRQRFLVAYLRVALVAAFATALVDLFVPVRLASGTVLILIAVPVSRVVWLVVRWLRRRDWRFALTGVALVSVLVVGLVLGRR